MSVVRVSEEEEDEEGVILFYNCNLLYFENFIYFLQSKVYNTATSDY